MIEGWDTYSVSDFLLFSEGVWRSLLESYNFQIWPHQAIMLVIGLGLVALLLRPTVLAGRIVALAVAFSWAWVGAVFHARHFVSINWAAEYFSWYFMGVAALVFSTGCLAGRLQFTSLEPLAAKIGFSLVLYAVALHGVVEWLLGRPWTELALFGWGADTTALATSGIALMSKSRFVAMSYSVFSLLWCLVAALMAYGLRSQDLYWLVATGSIAACGLILKTLHHGVPSK